MVRNWETREEMASSYFACGLIEHDKRWEYKRGQKALVVDGSGYSAALCVESDFGCTEWEAA